MSEKVACTACGAQILASTAADNGGLCTPCKGGYRHKIEEGKRQRAADKIAQANPDPITQHWRWLVGEVAGYRFPVLSPENQIFFATTLLEGEVYNGGFLQFFHNSSGDYYAYAVRGLTEIGAPECRDILLAAKQAIFGADDVPDERFSRATYLEQVTPATERRVNELAHAFLRAAAVARPLFHDYGRRHGLFDGFR
jgi:hypothetical protein